MLKLSAIILIIHNRTAQSGQSNAVGEAYEQYPQPCNGNSQYRIDLLLIYKAGRNNCFLPAFLYAKSLYRVLLLTYRDIWRIIVLLNNFGG